MISSLGIIDGLSPSGRLNRFVPDEEIKKHLAYLAIPLVEESDTSESGSAGEEDPELQEEELREGDKILFATPNNEDISTLAFFVYNDTDLFLHHDVYVFSTILDSAPLPTHGGAPLVAVATCEHDIFVYDSTVNFPVLPQMLLVGHSGPVNALKTVGEVLWSAGEDGHLIDWDLNKLEGQESIVRRPGKNLGLPIERFDMEGQHLVYGSERFVNIDGESINLENGIEKIKIQNDKVYIPDESGNLLIYDFRNLKEAYHARKVHENAIYDLAFYGDAVVTSSADGLIKTWNASTLEETGRYERPSAVCSLCFDASGELFCGDESGSVSKLSIDKLVR